MASPGPPKRPKLEAVADGNSLLLSSLGKLTEGVNKVAKEGREAYETSATTEYVDLDNKNGICRMFRPVQMYADSMTALGVKTRAQLEEVWREQYKVEEVRDCVEELLSAEENFENFLAEVERGLQKEEEDLASLVEIVTVGSQLPSDLSFLEAKPGKERKLESCWKKSRFTLMVLMRHFA